METITSIILKSAGQVWTAFVHNWPYLTISILMAVGLKLLLDPEKAKAFLLRHNRVGILGATAVAVATPFCSCGTTAVLLGMMASSMPWAPIIAFMVSSPLSSPEGMVYSAGLFGWPFAIFYFTGSIILGLAGGLIGDILEKRNWLVNQSRYESSANRQSEKPAVSTCGCGSAAIPAAVSSASPLNRNKSISRIEMKPYRAAPASAAAACCPGSPTQVVVSACSCGSGTDEPQAVQQQPAASARTINLKTVPRDIWDTGKRLLWMFFAYAFIGYVLNNLIPSAWVSTLFGATNVYSVPLAATLGIPLYINSEASIPLVRALIDGGMSQGAAMAFLITGSGTSIGAFMGALAIARWKVIAIVVGTLWVGAILLGYLYNLLLVAGIL